jgi:hypothetical protein
MDTLFLQTLYQRNERLCLESRLATTECHATPFAKERFLVHCHAHDVLNVRLLALTLAVNRIGVGTIETTEVTSLQKNHETQTRTIECTQ